MKKLTQSDVAREYLAEWMIKNEHTLVREDKPYHNYGTSGRKAKNWTREAIGTFNGRKFRAFSKTGQGDLDKEKRPSEFISYETPKPYAVVWFENDKITDLEWMTWDELNKIKLVP